MNQKKRNILLYMWKEKKDAHKKIRNKGIKVRRNSKLHKIYSITTLLIEYLRCQYALMLPKLNII